jgi:hypothetical protein
LLAAQIAVWMTMGLPPHIWKHWIGWPPACVHEMMHWSDMRHAGLARHACACMQHFAAMQSKQAPPGEPQLLGGPQTPFEH